MTENNSSKLHSSPLIFLPGTMGSSLIRTMTGKYGQVLTDEIWGSDMSVNLEFFREASRTVIGSVYPGAVISEMRYGFLRKPLYGDLISFFTETLGFVPEKDFHPIPYDWRNGCEAVADEIAPQINAILSRTNGNLKIVAHSMGGIVARILLEKNPEIAARTSVYVQIASPIKGAAKAYYTLKEKPKLQPTFDWVWACAHHIRPGRRADLMAVLRGFQSIYDLLPSETILKDPSGERFSVFQKQGIWPKGGLMFAENAKRTHEYLKKPVPGEIRHISIYSGDRQTDDGYVVDEFFNIKHPELSLGDGTVVCASAFHGTAIENRRVILRNKDSGEDTEHTKLCSHPEVFKILEDVLQ